MKRSEFLAVILGASEWPNSPIWQNSIAFKNSAEQFKDYLLDPNRFGLPSDHLLNLFDDPRAVSEIDYEVDSFLRRVPAQLGHDITDILVYFVGHGAFVEGEQRYCLVLRSSRAGKLGSSAYRLSSLARTVNQTVRNARRFLIIDACYASAAQWEFIPQSDAATRLENQAMEGFAESGTALLCAASSVDVALAPKSGQYTMFSGAVLSALINGAIDRGPLLSFDDMRFLAERDIRQRFRDEAVLPELHIPDQRKGSISTIGVFPNLGLQPQTGIGERSIPEMMTGVIGAAVGRVDNAVRQSSIRTFVALAGLTGAISWWLYVQGVSPRFSFFLPYEIPPSGELDLRPLAAKSLLPGITFGCLVALFLYRCGIRSRVRMCAALAFTVLAWVMAGDASVYVFDKLGVLRVPVERTVSKEAMPTPPDQINEDAQPTGPVYAEVPRWLAMIPSGAVGGFIGGFVTLIGFSVAGPAFRKIDTYIFTLVVASLTGTLLLLWDVPFGLVVVFVAWQAAFIGSIGRSIGLK